MHQARIAELLTPFLSTPAAISSVPRHSSPGQRPGEEPAVLSPTQLQHISTYIDILLRWNAHINLTAIRDPEQIVTRHFGESLFAALHLFPGFSTVPPVTSVVKDLALADVGSGAGFPGIPIQLWAPDITLTLIESNHKKATFLREVARALTLTDINIQNTRAQDLPKDATNDSPTGAAASPQTFDMVTLRAVERFDDILPTAASLLRPEGRLALLIGSSQQAIAEATLPRISWNESIPIPQSRSRILLIGTRKA